MKKCPSLYLISPPQIEISLFLDDLELVFDYLGDSVTMFQLRLKKTDNLATDPVDTSYIVPIVKLCREYQVKLIINDQLELASSNLVDGIHVGQNQLSELANFDLEQDTILGVSCYNDIRLAKQALKYQADYISFGSFFVTNTKPNAQQANLNIINDWQDISKIPCCAIGGINIGNIKQVMEYQPDYICISGGIWQSHNMLATLEALRKIIQDY